MTLDNHSRRLLPRRQFLRLGTAAAVASAAGAWPLAGVNADTGTLSIVVHKTPTCGCCGLWIEHLESAGFEVDARNHDAQALDDIKRSLGIPRELWSCHTGVADGYVVEGHIPAGDVRRLLSERPDGIGIAVPGMPIGSPGMEVGDRRDPYDVILFGDDGLRRVFASH
jgi:hypothetical protein